jgi:hypothetical protein
MRDKAQDPRPGDVVTVAKDWTREVISVGADRITFIPTVGGYRMSLMNDFLEMWRGSVLPTQPAKEEQP